SLENVSLCAPNGKYTIDHVQDEKQKKYPKMKLKLDSSNIEEADYVKYLGLIVDQQMTFQQHINYVYSKAAKELRPSLSVYNLLYTKW
ncbi:hypothetical protein RFI_37463, partial [Reticulomyxa filosa]